MQTNSRLTTDSEQTEPMVWLPESTDSFTSVRRSISIGKTEFIPGFLDESNLVDDPAILGVRTELNSSERALLNALIKTSRNAVLTQNFHDAVTEMAQLNPSALHRIAKILNEITVGVNVALTVTDQAMQARIIKGRTRSARTFQSTI